MKQTIIGEHMVKFPYTAEPKTTVREAFYLMEEWQVRHLPIIDGGKVIGVVSERDLRVYFNTEGDTKLCDIMTITPYCVRIGTPLQEVLAQMDRQKIGSAIVVTSNDSVLGIFTTTDAVRLLRRFLKEDPGGASSKWMIEEAFEPWENLNSIA